MPRERDRYIRDDRSSGWHKDGEDDRHTRKPKRSAYSVERGAGKKRNLPSDANSIMPNPWAVPPNSKNAVPMFLPGMMMPPQFPSYLMQMPFPTPDGEQVKAFQKAMMAPPFNTFPPKGMPPGLFMPQPKLASALAKKRPKIAKEPEFEVGYPENDPPNMYMRLKKEIFDGLQKELRSQEPHLVRLMGASGLFDRNNMDPSSRNLIIKLFSRALDDKNYTQAQHKRIRHFIADLRDVEPKKSKQPPNLTHVMEKYQKLNLGQVKGVLPLVDGLE